jgi:integral membrane sensor domain MASE1
MVLDDEKKADVLLKLLEENRKSAEWVKNLDFKLTYYPIGLFVAAIAWFATHPPEGQQKWVILTAVFLVALLSTVFLSRNHRRHATLNRELDRIRSALLLKTPGQYGPAALADNVVLDLEFHLGRLLYVFFLWAGASLTAIFIVWGERGNGA